MGIALGYGLGGGTQIAPNGAARPKEINYGKARNRYTPYALAALRVAAALIFIEHGTQKLFGFPAAPEGGLPEAGSLLWVGAWLELVGSLLAVRPLYAAVAFIVAGEMAVAYWMFHAPASFYPVLNGGDARHQKWRSKRKSQNFGIVQKHLFHHLCCHCPTGRNLCLKTIQENRSRELRIKNHKTEVENYQLELKQNALEEKNSGSHPGEN